jgi:hypothetical protein
MKLFQKAEFFSGLWRMDKNSCLSHTHTGSKVVLTAFESFRSENLKKKKKDSESACSEDSASLFRIQIEGLQAKLKRKTWNATSFALFE